MMLLNKNKSSMRNAYSEKLIEFGEKNENVVVLDADLAASTKTIEFKKKFPNRFFNVGIAEQNLINMACGLSLEGKICFVSSFAMFATGRAWEQIRNTLCYNNLNVKIIATHAGLTVGEDGASHQALEDVAILRAIPNILIISPCDYWETKKALDFSLAHRGPVYVRLSRLDVCDIFDSSYEFNKNCYVKIKSGIDATIITSGEMVSHCIESANILEKYGIDIEIIHMPIIKPINEKTLVENIKNNIIFTVENHSIIGGLGSAICEAFCKYNPKRVIRIGVEDKYGQSGKPQELLEHYGLSADKIAQKIRGYIKTDDKIN